jgi:hypothetical protein
LGRATLLSTLPNRRRPPERIIFRTTHGGAWIWSRALQLTELPPQDHLRKPEYLEAGSLGRWAQHVDHRPFQQGYIAGWQSVRGGDDQPVLVPPSPVFVGSAMYMVGYSRGARDAGG